MRRPTYANAKDANHSELVDAWLRFGGQWADAGPLDGWAGRYGIWMPVEIKSGEHRRAGAHDEFTDQEREFLQECEHRRNPYIVWRSLEDVVNFYATLTRGRPLAA